MSDLIIKPSGTSANFKVQNPSGTDKITMDSDGKVGIGTSSPGALLDIQGPAGTGSASAGVLRLSTAETSVVDADQLGRIEFIAPLEAGGTDAVLVGASIHAEADDTFAADNNSTDLVFSLGESGAATEKMRLTHDGFVGFGQTPSSSKKFAVVNMNGSSSPSAGAVHFDVSNNRLLYNSSSRRYKKNIRDIETDTSKIYKIECKSFETNDPDQDEVNTVFGLIAEELIEHFPTLVGYDAENRPDSINYAMLVVPLINELKKLKEEVTSLKKRIETLESE